MNLARGPLHAMAAIAVLSLGLTGCAGSDSTTAGATGAPAASGSVAGGAAAADGARADLAAAAAELQKGNFVFTATGHEEKTTGTMHLPSRSASLVVTSPDKEDGDSRMEVRLVDEKQYRLLLVKTPKEDRVDLADLPPDFRSVYEALSGKFWMRVDTTKIKPDSRSRGMRLDQPDISGASAMLSTVVTAQRTGDVIKGTVDLSAVPLHNTPWLQSDITAMGSAARTVPFEATLDGRRRLTRLAVDLPATTDAPAHRRVVELKDYGAAKPTTKPQGEIRDAPEKTYDLLNR
ncbi:hypothetical protein [Couchioplanes azureus]|uniref:hypothetical protein n=1 Tax=Couchioplanes caeruleus TaxID=56438 RepID=UPI0016706BA3|nr:hypothetical protein [Couchioplanes caeruleus]GGQ42628.1 hypothetical protein GCM10010166_08450 [Couchioplanes caeruleus subsp. azureus]